MMKKILAALLASAMVVSSLAACGSSDTTAASTESKEETTAESKETETEETETETEETDVPETEPVTEEPAEKTHIVIYRTLYNRGSVDDDEVQAVEDELNARLDAKGAGVEIEIHEIHNSEYADTANLALAAGEMNILWNASWWSTIGTDDIWRQNGAYDITDLVAGTDLWNSMDEGIWEASKYDGKILFIPVYKESYEGYDMKTPKVTMDKCGWTEEDFADVHSLEDLEPFVKEAYEAGVEYPFDAYQYFYRYYLDYFDFFGGSSSLLAVDRETNEVVNAVDTDLYRDFCKLMGKWSDLGYIKEAFQTDDTAALASLTQTDKWAFEPWTCVPGDELANSEERDQQEEYIIEGFTGKYIHSTTTLGSCYTITANCTEEEAKAAIEWLGYLYTDSEIADIYTFGIEGTDFEYVEADDGTTRVHCFDESTYNHSAWESTSIKALTLLDNEPADKIEDYEAKNGAAETSCAAGFRFDHSDEAIDAILAACENLNTTYGKKLETGAYGEAAVDATIDEYLAALDEAGYQDLLAEAQRQYNEWKAE